KERLEDSEAVRRFRREIRVAAQLNHPNIVHTHDADEVGGTHFLVMEFIAGTDLGKLVGQKGPLPVATACEYVRQSALGLAHAWERGVIHRDIKPGNLMLTPDGTVKILDFGLARHGPAADSQSSELTSELQVMGTPDFIAPEQARGSHDVDGRAD